MRGHARTAVHRKRDELRSGCSASPNGSPYVKDGINDYVVHGDAGAVNPARTGTKAAAHYRSVARRRARRVTVRLRLTRPSRRRATRSARASTTSSRERMREADEFYATVIPADLSPDARNVMRQAFAGMLWSKQFYHYVVRDWLKGDPAARRRPPERLNGRNHEWTHLYNADVISMPDKWEYPVVRGVGPGVPLRAAGAGRFASSPRSSSC